MNSSDVIEDSFKDSNFLDCSVEDSLISRPSFEGVVEDSFNAAENSKVSVKKSNLSNASRQSRTMSSDEDVDYEAITRSSRKPRIRRIASDSENEYEQDSSGVNSSFKNHRPSKILDSDEDDDEHSSSSFTETSDTSNLKEINSPKKNKDMDDESIRKSWSLKHEEPSSSSEDEHSTKDEDEHSSTSFTETSDTSNLREINSPKENKVMEDELSSRIRESCSLKHEEPSSSSKDEHSTRPIVNKSTRRSLKESFKEINEDEHFSSPMTNKSPRKLSNEPFKEVTVNESFRDKVDISSSSDQSDDEVIAVSSGDEADSFSLMNKKPPNIETKLHQPTIDSLVTKMPINGAASANNLQSNSIFCTAAEYANQSEKVSNLRTDILKCKNMLRTVNLSSLPDKGVLLIKRHGNLENQLRLDDEKLKRMVVEHKTEPTQKTTTWEQLQANSAYVVPNTFGKTAMNTLITQKTLTMDRLKNLHDSLATCPNEDTLAEDPKGLNVELMRHQKRALAWLMWREGQKPAGGILADDMGLGKTLTMISLMLVTKEANIEEATDSEDEAKENSSKWTSKSNMKVEGGTLVICPATLIRQWESEIESKLKRNLLSVEMYHGTNRDNRVVRLARYDVVITTYKLAQGEFEKKGPLFKIKWKRIILDEAHVIRNPKSLTSVAICDLKAKARWALTGTPVHNKELDLYALLKYLRCSPFDDINVWKRWVANKNAGGQDRLNTVITSILLRRTKADLQSQGSLLGLPEKKFEIIEVSLDKTEKQIYQKVLVFSRTLFIQFLHQRAAKNPEFSNIKGGDLTQTNDAEFNKMHRKIMQMHGNTEVKSHEILVLLLRLRQICCHPSLISSMLDQNDCAAEGIEDGVAEGIEDDGVDIDLMDKLNNLNLDEEKENENPTPGNPESFATAANKVLSKSNPVFAADRVNEKLRIIKKIIDERVIPNDDKMIIVSQWTGMLYVIMRYLKSERINCTILEGKVPVHKRNDLVVDFNNPKSRTRILLLSLTAGGVGLNLVGANHLLLVDLHWNPQLESQAQDRIYRVGQTKVVHIYKIVTLETIEEKIKALQDSKLSLATDILAGVRPGHGSKLSLDDLKMLFNVAS